MKTFLVPVDFSPVTEEIIRTALGFAEAFQGRILLLNVIQPPIITGEYALPVVAVQEAMVAGEQAAREKLAGYSEKFRTSGFPTEALVKQGLPGYVILEEAKKAKADYIIIGSHGHGRLYDLLVGSTASSVIKKASCGVIVIPPADKHR